MRKEHVNFLKEVYRTSSITAAAGNLNISPQALSSSIRILERELDFAILHRTNQGVVFTNEGLRFLNTAKNFYEEIEQLQINQQKPKRDISINLASEFSDHYGLLLIKALTEGNEGINFSINIANYEQMKRKLKNKEINSYIVITPRYEDKYFPDNKRIKKEGNFIYEKHFLNEIARLHCLVPKSSVLYNFKNISLKTAAKYPCCFTKSYYDSNSSIRFILNTIVKFENAISFPNLVEYKANVILGNHISFDFINKLSDWYSYTNMVNIIPLKECIALHLCVITRKGEPDEELIEALSNGVYD